MVKTKTLLLPRPLYSQLLVGPVVYTVTLAMTMAIITDAAGVMHLLEVRQTLVMQ